MKKFIVSSSNSFHKFGPKIEKGFGCLEGVKGNGKQPVIENILADRRLT